MRRSLLESENILRLFYEKLFVNRTLLWDLDISPNGVNICVLRKQIGLSSSFFYKSEEAAKLVFKINQLLISEGIIIDGEKGAALNGRRMLLRWWNSLSLQDKLGLETHGNKLNLPASVYPHVPTLKGSKRYPLVMAELENTIYAELSELGVLSDDYETVQYRTGKRDKEWFSRRTDNNKYWFNLGRQKLESIDDFMTPTTDYPYVQVHQLFSLCAASVPSDSGKRNYKDGAGKFVTYLQSSGIKDGKLSNILTPFTFTDFKVDFIDKKIIGKELSTASSNTCLSTLRVALDKACLILGLNFHYYNAAGVEVKRVTDTYKPLSKEERKIFDEALDNSIAAVESTGGDDGYAVSLYLTKLMRITGINQESALNLELDSFVDEHHLTRKPCFRYWKERSDGGKEFHLELMDAELNWLPREKAKAVRQIFNKVIDITSGFRESLSLADSEKLFVFKSAGQRCLGKILPFTIARLNSAFQKFIKVDLADYSMHQFNHARLRPTFVSELIEIGASIREIQLMLGHSSIETTMGYLDKLDFNKIARDKLSKALVEIHSKSKEQHSKPLVSVSLSIDDDEIIFKTPLGGCRNIMKPPMFIKESHSFKQGSPCSQFNKCLSCHNVIITKSHLPELFALQEHYVEVSCRSEIRATPYFSVIEENLGVLNSILDPEHSDFSYADLEEGKRLSLFTDVSNIEGMQL